MWLGAAALFAAAAVAPADVGAQQQAVSVAAGVEAQFRAALIRERRLADERVLELIAAAETRMREARSAADAAAADRGQAAAELGAARAEYLRLVESVPLRDALTRIEVEAFRAEVEGSIEGATPELVAAYQQFADGDRVSAWATLEPLLRARAEARLTAARAVAAGEIRQIASLREIMRVSGEATAIEVLALWDQAAELDPHEYWTHLYRTRLNRSLNRIDQGIAAVRAARDAAGDTRERIVVSNDLGDLMLARNDVLGALAEYRGALAGSRELLRAEPDSADLARDVTLALNKVGDVLMAQGDFRGALEVYSESLSMRRGARWADAMQRRRDLMAGLTRYGDALAGVRDSEGAMRVYQESLQLARESRAEAPDSGDVAQELWVSLNKVGELLRRTERNEEAMVHYREAMEIAQALRAADPTSADRARNVLVQMDQIASLPNSEIRWSQVVAFAEEMQQRGQLADRDRPHVALLRQRAAAQDGRPAVRASKN